MFKLAGVSAILFGAVLHFVLIPWVIMLILGSITTWNLSFFQVVGGSVIIWLLFGKSSFWKLRRSTKTTWSDGTEEEREVTFSF